MPHMTVKSGKKKPRSKVAPRLKCEPLPRTLRRALVALYKSQTKPIKSDARFGPAVKVFSRSESAHKGWDTRRRNSKKKPALTLSWARYAARTVRLGKKGK